MALSTDQEIMFFITTPKVIMSKHPANSYRQENGYKRCNLQLLSTIDSTMQFEVFIRQNETFIENYSIGLRYQTGSKGLRTLTLTRFNGPHGEFSRSEDGHFAAPHIHKITAVEIELGSTQPQESHREITDRYYTFHEALLAFFLDTGVTNYADYFPELIQPSLFDEH